VHAAEDACHLNNCSKAHALSRHDLRHMATSAPGPGMPTLMTRGQHAGSASAGSKSANSPSGSSSMPLASGWITPGGSGAGSDAEFPSAAGCSVADGTPSGADTAAAAAPAALSAGPAPAAVLAPLMGGRESAVFPDAG